VLDLASLLRAVEDVLRGMPQPMLHRVVPRPLDVEGATRRIEALLADRERFDLREAFGEAPTVADVVSTLLAILELARLGRVHLAQRTPFSPVDVNRGPVEQAA
jgi:chromatin segregation and condensation protein Rec8/ScpA/Scc1 (kleisin family)